MIENTLYVFALAAWALPLLGVGVVALILSFRQREAYPRAARLAFWAGLLIVGRVLVVGPLIKVSLFFTPVSVAALGQVFAALVVSTAFALLLWAAFPVKIDFKELLVRLQKLRLPRFLKKEPKE